MRGRWVEVRRAKFGEDEAELLDAGISGGGQAVSGAVKECAGKKAASGSGESEDPACDLDRTASPELRDLAGVVLQRQGGGRCWNLQES